MKAKKYLIHGTLCVLAYTMASAQCDRYKEYETLMYDAQRRVEDLKATLKNLEKILARLEFNSLSAKDLTHDRMHLEKALNSALLRLAKIQTSLQECNRTN